MDVMVNYWAVLVATIAAFVLGWLWFSVLFQKPYIKATAMPSNGNMKGMGKMMGGQFVALLVTAYVLAHFVSYMNVATTSVALQLAFWAWLGIGATFAVTGILFERKSAAWFWITSGYQLVSMALITIILVAWK